MEIQRVGFRKFSAKKCERKGLGVCLLVLGAALSACSASSSEEEENPQKLNKVFTVHFDGNGADTAAVPTSKTVTAPATTLDALPVPPTRAGFAFNNWHTEREGGSLFDENTPVTADMTVYAHWAALPPVETVYIVTFDGNGADIPASPQTLTVTSPATTLGALPVQPERADHVFVGWNTARNGTGTAFHENTPVTANLTVYAQWVYIPVGQTVYIVTFDSNGGTVANPPVKLVFSPSATTLDELPVPPTRAGYVFVGWNTARNGTGNAFHENTPVTASLTVYAQWAALPPVGTSYTVTFDGNGASTPASPQTLTVTSPATTLSALPAPPERAGYVFAGWNTARNGTGTVFTPATHVTADMTVYAQWVALPPVGTVYTVTFDGNGASTPASPQTLTVTSPATTLSALPAPPERAGYAFVGWNTARNGTGTVFDENTPVTGNRTVYAQWKMLLPLSVQVSPDTAVLTPMKDGAYDGRLVTVRVAVSGFANPDVASGVQLEISTPHALSWLSWQNAGSNFSAGTKTFELLVSYTGTLFSEGPATLSLHLKNIPEDYATPGGTSLHIAVASGLESTRPIPVNKDNIHAFNRYANTTEGLARHYKLTENVELKPPPAGQSNWVAIGDYFPETFFTGSFDGGGFTLTGLTLNSNNYGQGLFGATGESAVIKNLGLKDVSIQAGGYVGGVVWENRGTVENCYVTGSVTGSSSVGGVVGRNSGTVQNCHATGSVMGSIYSVGGVVGINTGTVRNCYAENSVTGFVSDLDLGIFLGGVVGLNYEGGVVENCYATGDVSGLFRTVGGVVGSNEGTVRNCYATGDVSGRSSIGGLVGDNFNGTVHNSYATGSVTGIYDSVGGLVGLNRGAVSNSYATGSVTGSYGVGGVVGHGYVHTSAVTVRNSVALNSSVTTTDSDSEYIGRVWGARFSADIVLSNNHARSDMKLSYGSGTLYVPTADTAQTNMKDGKNVDAASYNSLSFWQTTMTWDFTNDWEWKAGRLPTLRHAGGDQDPRVP